MGVRQPAGRGWEISVFGKKLSTLTRYPHLKLIPLAAECKLPLPNSGCTQTMGGPE